MAHFVPKIADVLCRVTYSRVAVNVRALRKLALLDLLGEGRLVDLGGWSKVTRQFGLFDPLLDQLRVQRLGNLLFSGLPSDCTRLF